MLKHTISHEIIEELVQNINPKLTTFFEQHRYLLQIKADTMPELVEWLLDDRNISPSESVAQIYDKEHSNRRKQRANWIKRTAKNISDYPDADNRKSFFYPWRESLLSDPSSCLNKFGTTDLHEIMDIVTERCKTWAKNCELLIDFPNFPYVGNIRIENCFYSDVFEEVCHYILSEHNGFLINFNKPQMTRLDNNPVFTAQRGTMAMDLISKEILAFSSDKYKVRYVDISSQFSEKFPLFDTRDNEILSCLINNSIIEKQNMVNPQSKLNNPKDPSKNIDLTPMHQINLHELTCTVCNTKKPSAGQREDIKKRLSRLVTPVEVSNEEGGFFYKWVFLQRVLIMDEKENAGQSIIQYQLGEIVNEALVNNRLRNLNTSKYNLLESSYSKQLYSYLVLERAKLVAAGEKELKCVFPYNYLVRCLVLRYSKSRNMKIIREALQENCDKGIIIQEFEVKGNNIQITFLPLTNAELADLSDTMLLEIPGQQHIDADFEELS